MKGSKLYVGNLDYSVTKEKLEELFSNYGMSDSTEAEKAKEALNGSDFEGRSLKVNEARPSKPKGGHKKDFRGSQRGGYGRY
jgi:RNA recognition motif-containing protein